MRTQVGQELREARLKKGLDLYEVKRVTKIRVPALRAIEEDRWDDVPAPGPEALIEIYAEFLGLDEQALLRESGEVEPHASRHRRDVLLVLGVAAVVGLVIGLVAVGPLGGNGGESTDNASTGASVQLTTTTAAPSAPVSVELHTYALVWVCLVDQRGRAVINGLDLLRDQTVGPYDGKSFDVTFGNGKVDLTVNGQPVDVPPIAAPFGYRITPEGATRLAPADQPSCT